MAFESSAPATIHTVLVGGTNGDGIILDERTVDVPGDSDSLGADFAAVDAAIAAILQARDDAGTAGHHVVSTGVTVTDPIDADALASRLAASGLGDLSDIAFISPSLAAASLACKMGRATSCDTIGLLSVDMADVTLAMVDCGDGSVTRIFRQPLHDGDATAAVDAVAARLGADQTSPGDLVLVCTGVDAAAAIRPRLEASVPQVVSAPRDPQAALAHGAALATARLTEAAQSSTAALAYTQEADSGAFTPGYYDIPGAGADDLAYSAVPDEQDDAATEILFTMPQPARRPLLVAGAVLASTAFAAASALMVSLALDITPNLISLRPDFGRALALPFSAPSLQVPAGQPDAQAHPLLGQTPTDSLPPVNLPPVAMPPGLNLPAPAPLDVPAAPDMRASLPAAVPVAAPVLAPAPVVGPQLPSLLPALRPHPIHQTGSLPDLSFLLRIPATKPAPP
ncbi:hypothetical protein KV112_22515, partial [Mycolicibacter sp. MYC123]